MTELKNDTKCRKYLLTFNNPLDHNVSHETINKDIDNFNWSYYCMCDEIGEEGTYHTHLFFQCENAVRFSKVKKVFSSAHIDECNGTAEQNKNYILKLGKYEKTDKAETNLPDTFEEYGELPLDKTQKNKSISADVFEMIKEKYSDIEIIEKYPSYQTKIQHLDKTRQLWLEDKYKKTFRTLEVTYISGETATGKTRSVMEQYGYEKVYKITNYKNPFDNYNGQDVILFDEFRDSIPLKDMLQYIDGYPCTLPARFADKVACYTKVYIVSNYSLDKQYTDTKKEDWSAFLRRINHVLVFKHVIDDDNPFISCGEKALDVAEVPVETYEMRGRRY